MFVGIWVFFFVFGIWYILLSLGNSLKEIGAAIPACSDRISLPFFSACMYFCFPRPKTFTLTLGSLSCAYMHTGVFRHLGESAQIRLWEINPLPNMGLEPMLIATTDFEANAATN